MQSRYQEAFAALNSRQRQAVESIDGPVLVIAGPGTGKTQLISTRVGYILKNTDTPADAILLLTFTEAGVEAMRERLSQLIGKAAYDVQLSTYHAFGGDIFRRFPDYFEGAQLSLLEELGADSLLRGIIAKLPYSDPLKFADTYIDDLKTFISEAKRALLTPQAVADIAKHNLEFISKMNKTAAKVLNRLSTVSKKTAGAFDELLRILSTYPRGNTETGVLPLAHYAANDLQLALAEFLKTGKTASLTGWKRRWLARDSDGNVIFDGRRANERLESAAAIYRRYQRQLRDRHLFDYDDMIIRSIETLEANPELKYSLADRFSYIMLDEFQDTNPAQFKLVQLLSDHPVHEGRPNILAVGDDDQAIYAFQGADHANMASFVRHYKDVKTIILNENYRSWPQLLDVSQNIASQIQDRLSDQFEAKSKRLRASAKDLPGPQLVQARRFKSDAAQYVWVAAEIDRLVKSGMPADKIAVLAPKHRYLAPLIPYMANHKLPVRYDRRENILDEPLMHQLEQMARLVVALASGDERQSDHLWPQVLSYDFWGLAVERIWQISWQSSRSHEPWTSLLLNDEGLKDVAAFFIKLSTLLEIIPLEGQIDALIGTPGTSKNLKLPLTSPLYEHYFSKPSSRRQPVQFSQLIGALSVLRSRLDVWRQNYRQPTGLRALVEFIDGHRAAGLSILNTSPYHDSHSAVNVLTAYGSKGREFNAVFIISANDEVWGSASRNQGYRLSLPANLSYIRYQGASEDERLRLLYVAASRARSRLYFTAYDQDLAGKRGLPLKYMNVEEKNGKITADILPPKSQIIVPDRSVAINLAEAVNYWTTKHLPPFSPSLSEVLRPKLKAYKLSSTDLSHFVDIASHGPEDFFMKGLLKFPVMPAATDSFGTAIHSTLRFAGGILINEGKLPDADRLIGIFQAQLGRIELPLDVLEILSLRGSDSLRTWLAQSGSDLKRSDFYEYDFQAENSRFGNIPLTGKIDRLIVDERRRAITVLDYKTGRAYSRWQPGVTKLQLFQRQLMFYKLLVENSARFRRYTVEKGLIEFVEPDESGHIQRLEFIYDEVQQKRMIQLIKTVWNCIQALNFPDIGGYPATAAGIRQFEDDLISQKQNKSTG